MTPSAILISIQGTNFDLGLPSSFGAGPSADVRVPVAYGPVRVADGISAVTAQIEADILALLRSSAKNDVVTVSVTSVTPNPGIVESSVDVCVSCG